MKTIYKLTAGVLMLTLLVGGVRGLSAQDEEKALTGKETTPEQGVTAGIIASYLDKMGYVYEMHTADDVPKIYLTVQGKNNGYDVRILIDNERDYVYMCVTRLLTCPATHPRLVPLLQRLMELNWQLLIGKYEWDNTYGEVRLSYTFSTENGLGYEAFVACFQLLVMAADEYYPELMRIMWGPEEEKAEPLKVKTKPEVKPSSREEPLPQVEPKPKEEPPAQTAPQPEVKPEPEEAEQPQPAVVEPEPEPAPQTEGE